MVSRGISVCRLFIPEYVAGNRIRTEINCGHFEFIREALYFEWGGLDFKKTGPDANSTPFEPDFWHHLWVLSGYTGKIKGLCHNYFLTQSFYLLIDYWLLIFYCSLRLIKSILIINKLHHFCTWFVRDDLNFERGVSEVTYIFDYSVNHFNYRLIIRYILNLCTWFVRGHSPLYNSYFHRNRTFAIEKPLKKNCNGVLHVP